MAARDSRIRLLPSIDNYLEWIASVRHEDDKSRIPAINDLAKWMTQRIQRSSDAAVIVVCTGNSRRSVFASVLGNALAARLVVPVRFFSGGTKPSAVDWRTIRALEEVGFQIHATGKSACESMSGASNPIFHVRWSVGGTDPDQRREMDEFSKMYDDEANPRSDFAALMVCNEASQECPIVQGASFRVSIPFDDPKRADGMPDERAEYASRRDEIARVLHEVLSETKILLLAGTQKLPT